MRPYATSRLRLILSALAVVSLMVPASALAARPTIAISRPEAGTTVTGTVPYAAKTHSARKVRFYVDDNLLAVDRTRPYSTRLRTRKLSNGKHLLSVWAIAGSRTVSSKTTVRVKNRRPDTTPPTAPTDVALGNGGDTSLEVTWSPSSDNVGVAGYDVLLDGVRALQTNRLSAIVGDLECGQSYTIGVRAFDAAGNRSALTSIAISTLACPSTPETPTLGVNWFPGYYVLAHRTTAQAKQNILNDPLVEPFTGVQFRYHWSETELTPGDYSAGFAQLDADLKSAAERSKRLLVMLQYKKHDGTAAVPSYLRSGPGSWCSGPYCGELVSGDRRLAMVWNDAVGARLQAWISAMAAHIAASPYAANAAGIVFNETSLPTVDRTLLAEAGYDPYVYMRGLQGNLLAATNAAPHLPVFYYHEGGFVSMDGESVKAGQVMGDWMLEHPHTGTGTPDLKPKDPKTTSHPCAIPSYQGRIPCNPDVQAGDYALTRTDSLDQSFEYAVSPAPNGLLASYLTFSYGVGSGPNAFTFADVSRYIPLHPVPNVAVPPGW